MKASAGGALVLIPWHIGHIGDVTVSALDECRRLSRFIVEDPGETRRQLEVDLRINCAAKEFVEITFDEDPKVLGQVLAWLAEGDVGMLPSGGAPCFVDPGAWLVRAVRERGAHVKALAGASALSAVLSLSGMDMARFHFLHFPDGPSRVLLAQSLETQGDHPLVVFLGKDDVDHCMAVVRDQEPERKVSILLDVAKRDSPVRDRIETWSSEQWKEKLQALPLSTASEVAFIVHPPSMKRPQVAPAEEPPALPPRTMGDALLRPLRAAASRFLSRR